MSNDLQHVVPLSPEGLLVANKYLLLHDSDMISEATKIPVTEVNEILSRKEVKAYLDQIAFQHAEKNFQHIQDKLQTIVESKLEEMEDSEMGSRKDIADLLDLQFKQQAELMKLRIKLLEAETKKAESTVRVQNNYQINNNGASGYDAIMEKLIGGK